MEAAESDPRASSARAQPPPLSYSQLFSFQVLYASSSDRDGGTAKQPFNINMSSDPRSPQEVTDGGFRRGILEMDFFMETFFIQERDRIFMSEAFPMLRNHVDLNNSEECSISIKFDSRQWEVITQNVAEKTCIQHLLECIVNNTSIEEALQIGIEKGIIGLDKRIQWHGSVRIRASDQKKHDERYLILVPGKLLLFKNSDIIGKHVRYVTSLLGATVQMLPKENEFQVLVPGSQTMSFISSDTADIAWITDLEMSIDYANRAASSAGMVMPSTRKKRISHGSKMCGVQRDAANFSDIHQLKISGYGDTNINSGLAQASQKHQLQFSPHDVHTADNNILQDLHANKHTKTNRDFRMKDPKKSSNAILSLENALNEMNMAITHIKTGKQSAILRQMSPPRFSASMQEQHDKAGWRCESKKLSDSVDALISPRMQNVMASGQYSKSVWELSSPNDVGENLQNNQVRWKSHSLSNSGVGEHIHHNQVKWKSQRLGCSGNVGETNQNNLEIWKSQRLHDSSTAGENIQNNQITWKAQRLGDYRKIGKNLQNNQVTWRSQRVSDSSRVTWNSQRVGSLGPISREHETSQWASNNYAHQTSNILPNKVDKQSTICTDSELYRMTASHPEEHQYAQIRMQESSEFADNACNAFQMSPMADLFVKPRYMPHEKDQVHLHSQPNKEIPQQGKVEHMYQNLLTGMEFPQQQDGSNVFYDHSTKNTEEFMSTSQKSRDNLPDTRGPCNPRSPFPPQENAGLVGPADADGHVACRATFPYDLPRDRGHYGSGNTISTEERVEDTSKGSLHGPGDYTQHIFPVTSEGLYGKMSTLVGSGLSDQQSPSSDYFSPLEHMNMFQQRTSSQFIGTLNIKQKDAQVNSQQQSHEYCSPEQPFMVMTDSGKSMESSKPRKCYLESDMPSKRADIFSDKRWHNGAYPSEYQQIAYTTEIDVKPAYSRAGNRAPTALQDAKSRNYPGTNQSSEALEGLTRSTQQNCGMYKSAVVHRQSGQYQVSSRQIKIADNAVHDQPNRNPLQFSESQMSKKVEQVQINGEMTGAPVKNLMQQISPNLQKNNSALSDTFMQTNPSACTPVHEQPKMQTQAVLNQQFYSQVISELENPSQPVSYPGHRISEIATAAARTVDFQRSDLVEGSKSMLENCSKDKVSEMADLVNKLIKITTGEETNLKRISFVGNGSSENDVQYSINKSYDLLDRLPVMNGVIPMHETSQETASQTSNLKASMGRPQFLTNPVGLNSIGDDSTAVQVQYINPLTIDRSSSSCPITLKSADGEVIILGKERRSSSGGPATSRERAEEIHLFNDRKQPAQSQVEFLRDLTCVRRSETCSHGLGSYNNVEGDAWSLAILKPGAPAQIFKFETV